MRNSTSSTGRGIGFTGLLTLLFIGLKLTGYIDWSWWWVLSPVIASVSLVALIVAGVYLMARGMR